MMFTFASEHVPSTEQSKTKKQVALACKSGTEKTTQCCSLPHQQRHVEATNDREDGGAAEIQSIMQRGKVRESPPTTFLGISPPRRSAGAANPLVQDWNWRSNAYKCSHSNLQALREIDARGVSFLRMSGDSALLIESPEQGGLVVGASDSSATTSCFTGSRNSCQVSSHRVQAKPMVCQVGFNVA
jgi:hypothetical protein